MSIIKVEGLSFTYNQAKCPAVNNISFEIQEGDFCAVVGSNGSGKSTLSRLLTSLEEPTQGKITYSDNASLGIVFQSPKDQIVNSIVNRDTAFGPKNLGLAKNEVELRTIECLNIVDLLEKAEKSTLNLSLGQTQKLSLAGNLALWPKILILDEAVAMLDPVSKKSILDFLAYWNRHGNTIIHITHDLEAVKQAKRVLCLEKGNLIFNGSITNFLAQKKLVQRLTGKALQKCDRKVITEKLAQKKTIFGFSNVNFTYEGEENPCLENISFELKEGSLTALIGASGSGKSTILELGSGLLAPKSGEIFGEDYASLAMQNCSDAVFEAIAADDVAFGPRNLGIKGEELKQRVKDSMNKVNLPFETFGEMPVSYMSGGQLRRLAIAGIIAMDKPVLFFDEPSAGLDGESRQEVMNLLMNLAREGKTVMFSTHNQEEADFAQREISICKGKIVTDSLEENRFKINNFEEKNRCKGEGVQQGDISFDTGLILSSENPAAEKLSSLRSFSNTLSGVGKKRFAPVEKLHPALRILLFLILFIVSLICRSILPCIIMLAFSLLYCVFCGFGFKSMVKSFIKILPFLLFFAFFQLVFRQPEAGEIRYINLKWFLVTPSKLIFCLNSLLKTYAALYSICGFYTSIKDYELIDGLRVIFYPLELIKIPMRYFYIVLEILFRFIPLLVDQTCGILKTQVIRGSMRKVKGKMAGIRAIVPLIVPLIIQTVKRSEALADAITMRCFK